MIRKSIQVDQRDFSAALRRCGLKITPGRVALLKLLARERKPLSVQKIVRRLGAGLFDQATVYRSLNAMTHAELIRRIDLRHGHAHYELADSTDHHHVVCVECNRIEDVTQCNLSKMTQSALRQSGFAEIRQHSLEFFGVCQKCRT